MTTQAAAEYADYSYDHFRGLVKKYQIPRRGPNNNRFAVSDLDRWMSNPNSFCEASVPTRTRKIKKVNM